MKNTVTHIVNYEKTKIFNKKTTWKVPHEVHQPKKSEYLKIQDSLQSKNLTILYIFLYPERYSKTQSKINNWNSQNLMIICLKQILEKCFSSNPNTNTSLKLF